MGTGDQSTAHYQAVIADLRAQLSEAENKVGKHSNHLFTHLNTSIGINKSKPQEGLSPVLGL